MWRALPFPRHTMSDKHKINDDLFPLYERLWREKARKHMANMTIAEVAKWLEMAESSKDLENKASFIQSAKKACDLYINEMRANNNY